MMNRFMKEGMDIAMERALNEQDFELCKNAFQSVHQRFYQHVHQIQKGMWLLWKKK